MFSRKSYFLIKWQCTKLSVKNVPLKSKMRSDARGCPSPGAPWQPLGWGITRCFTFWGHLFHIQFCTLPFALKSQIFVKTCAQNGVEIHSKCNFKSLYFSALFFCSFSGRSKVRTCVWAMPVQSKSLRAQITWHTKWVEKSSEKVHKYTKKAWLEHRLEKTWKKVARVLNMCHKCVKNCVQKGGFIFAFCPLAPPVAALALQSSSWCKKCCQRAPKMTMK